MPSLINLGVIQNAAFWSIKQTKKEKEREKKNRSMHSSPTPEKEDKNFLQLRVGGISINPICNGF